MLHIYFLFIYVTGYIKCMSTSTLNSSSASIVVTKTANAFRFFTDFCRGSLLIFASDIFVRLVNKAHWIIYSSVSWSNEDHKYGPSLNIRISVPRNNNHVHFVDKLSQHGRARAGHVDNRRVQLITNYYTQYTIGFFWWFRVGTCCWKLRSAFLETHNYRYGSKCQ